MTVCVCGLSSFHVMLMVPAVVNIAVGSLISWGKMEMCNAIVLCAYGLEFVLGCKNQCQ